MKNAATTSKLLTCLDPCKKLFCGSKKFQTMFNKRGKKSVEGEDRRAKRRSAAGQTGGVERKLFFAWNPPRRRHGSQTNSITVSFGHRRRMRGVDPMEHHLVVWCAELSNDDLVRIPQTQYFSTVFVEHPGISCQMMSSYVNHKSRSLGIDARPMDADLPLPISAEPSKGRRVYLRNSVEFARYGHTLCCPGSETAASVIPGLPRDHSEQRRARSEKKKGQLG